MPELGVRLGGTVVTNTLRQDADRIRWVIALLLCLFMGLFGVHRFYVRKTGTGILMLVTLGLLGVWTLIDLLLILFGAFKDAEGRRL